MTMPILAALSAPILLAVLLNHGDLYRWAQPVTKLDPIILAKRVMLNRWFFTLRVILYFAIWSGIAIWYWRRSTQQDESGDVALSDHMQFWSAPATLVMAITITFAA